MFSYYGSKSKIVDYYPPPKYKKIIEPFAGSARYSLKYWQNDITIVDKYDVVIEVWKYLQSATKEQILEFLKLNLEYRLSDIVEKNSIEWKFLGFLTQAGQGKPADTRTKMSSFEADIKRIANNLFKIRHWNIILGDYRDLENIEATWFIDPPYQFGGEYQYKYNNKQIDFIKLAEWCKSRNGQIIVCENTKAKWMDFKPMVNMKGTIHTTTEAIWSNYKTNYDAVQQTLQF